MRLANYFYFCKKQIAKWINYINILFQESML